MSSEEQSKGAFGKALFFLKFLEIRLRFVIVLVLTALVVGYWDNLQNYWERWTRGAPEKEQAAEIEYTCGMHPFVVSDRPGKCPICGMDLVTRKKGDRQTPSADALPRVQLSPERIHQAGVRTDEAQHRLLSRTVRTYGVIETDETRMRRIVARFPGRVEELLVNAVGLEVRKETPLLRIYSPRYLAAAQEYVQALAEQRRLEQDARASAEAKRSALVVAESARSLLALAGFTEAQLGELARGGKVEPRITLYTPLAGTVIEKNVLVGDAVEEGTVLYTVADLTTLWIQAQVVESDIGAVQAGMPVEVDSVAYPGQIFYGVVDLLYPTLNTANRSVKARIVVSNKEGKLKPGMFVTAVVRAPIGSYGPADETGKPPVAPPPGATATVYTCPMHPEVVSDKPGDCPKCGMHLVKKEAPPPASPGAVWAEGYACAMHLDKLAPRPGVCAVCNCGMQMTKWRVEKVLSIPETAVVDTGVRQYVFIEKETGLFDARRVTLGPRAGAYFPVLGGLAPGDRIVTRGSFLIDAEARLNPAGFVEPEGGPPAKQAAPAPASAPPGHAGHTQVP